MDWAGYSSNIFKHLFEVDRFLLMRQVLECCWADLKKQVAEASDLDHIIAAHETFLDQVLNRCLLDAESRVSKVSFRVTNTPVLAGFT